ncbi:MAG: rhodanese-like domain-containing protein [Actinomycetota bacterium]|nr:rhodanese-like domain-containing protein [Actinomycetota bacterium]|tara:strand:+ start:131 stop:583 length:453 start_codon:yes stop_codon:yes gene_type:complete
MQRTSINDLVKKAKSEIEELSVEEVKREISEGSTILIDIRDFRERLLEGTIPGAVSAPRGMIEWWFDPDSPYHKEEFTFDQRYVLFCSLGWRSALATSALKDLGFSNVAHLEQGFTGWVDSDQTVEKVTSGEKWFKNQSDIKSSLEITKE